MKLDRRGFLNLSVAASAMAGTPVMARSMAQELAPLDPSETIHLWPKGAPGEQGVSLQPIVPERSTDPSYRDRYAQYTMDPIMTVMRPDRPNGTAMLLIPGGGYRWAVLDKEGFDVARVFAASGTTCFILRYRLPADGWAAGADAPLQDVQRAIRLIRSRADELGIKPDRVAILGASAGGHLAGMASVRTDATYEPVDQADTQSLRPDLTLLMYPVVTMTRPHTHEGSRQHLLGATPSDARVAAYSLEQQDWRGAAPVFVLHSMDDESVPVENSLLLISQLRTSGVVCESHLFQEGGHGYGVRLIKGRPAEVWPELARRWADRLGFAL